MRQLAGFSQMRLTASVFAQACGGKAEGVLAFRTPANMPDAAKSPAFSGLKFRKYFGQGENMRWLTGILIGMWILINSHSTRAQAATWGIELEGGAYKVGRADVRIPGDVGDQFSLKNDLDADDGFYSRARFLYHPAQRHALLLTIAPFQAQASGHLARDTRFVDTTFSADAPVKAYYRFNNYRLTYRYLIKETDRFSAALGGTLFVRDARIKLESGDQSASDDDLGVVPLIHFRLVHRPHPDWAFLMDGDALAAPQGRAFDILAGVEYHINENMQAGLGYRLLEGGADNDKVYTFALFHHVNASFRWQF